MEKESVVQKLNMNNRICKFRAWDKHNKCWRDEFELGDRIKITLDGRIFYDDELVNWVLYQYTGLKDKNGLKEVYESDIIDVEGNIKGNIYENNKEATDLVIQGFGTKDWCATYQKAMELGLKNSE